MNWELPETHREVLAALARRLPPELVAELRHWATEDPLGRFPPRLPIGRRKVVRMFVETITQPREEWQTWHEKLRFLGDPPEALVASIAWDAADGKVTQLNVWDNPAAVGDFFVERAASVIEELGERSSKARRHGDAQPSPRCARSPATAGPRRHRP